MDFFSADFFSALLAVVVIDLVLAGDNAILIGLAARNLPKNRQKQVILWGMVGAIIVRSVATVLVVYLLRIPGLLLAGGLILIWIAYKLLTEQEEEEDVKASTSVWGAVRTIIIADIVMGLDNVLAVAGAAHGDIVLVIIGLLISVPIVIWGSTVVLKLIERYPFIIYIGAGVLAWTAAGMITDEPLLEALFGIDAVRWVAVLLIMAGVLGAGLLKNRTQKRENPRTQ